MPFYARYRLNISSAAIDVNFSPSSTDKTPSILRADYIGTSKRNRLNLASMIVSNTKDRSMKKTSSHQNTFAGGMGVGGNTMCRNHPKYKEPSSCPQTLSSNRQWPALENKMSCFDLAHDQPQWLSHMGGWAEGEVGGHLNRQQDFVIWLQGFATSSMYPGSCCPGRVPTDFLCTVLDWSTELPTLHPTHFSTFVSKKKEPWL